MFVNCNIVLGFMVFFGVRGIFRWWYKEINLFKLVLYWFLVLVINKKLFNMCKIDEVFRWWIDNYFNVVLKVLKMLYEEERFMGRYWLK